MGLTNVSSFAPCSSGGSVVALAEKPTGTVMVVSSSNNQVIYTVPAGKYFKGYIIHYYYDYPPKLNDVYLTHYINLDRTEAYYSSGTMMHFILYAGDSVKAGSYNQNNTQYGLKVIGSEFNL